MSEGGVVRLVPWKMDDDGSVVASVGEHVATRNPAFREAEISMSKWRSSVVTRGFRASGIMLTSLRRSARGCLGILGTRLKKMKDVFSIPLIRSLLRSARISCAKVWDVRSCG